jgi:effector-binding domain-containing protein
MWKKIIFGLLGLIVALVLVGFLLPGQTEVSRSLTVNAPAEYSFEEVNVLPNWQKWSYWNSLDPGMKVTYGDKVSGEGGWYSWESADMGNGKLIITESIPNSSIKADLDFIENGTAKAWYTFEPDGEATKVTMGFNTAYGMNPVRRWFGAVMMKSVMNEAFDYNLKKIKELAEAKPKFAIKISEENVAPISYVGITTTSDPRKMDVVSKQMEKNYTDLALMLKKSKVAMSGSAFCLYPKWSPESMEMVCAFPVAADAKLPVKYKVAQTAGGKAVKATHNGSYEKLQATHDELNKYIEYKKLQINGAPWEVYVTDPMVEKDTAKWITEIYYPVASN